SAPGDRRDDGPLPEPIFAARPAEEVRDELRFHADMRARELIANGMSPEQAQRLVEGHLTELDPVRRELDTPAMRRHAAQRRASRVAALVQDVHYALRMLRRRPAFATLAVATIALGIGAASAIYSVVDGVMLRPLPFRDPSRLVAIWVTEESF